MSLYIIIIIINIIVIIIIIRYAYKLHKFDSVYYVFFDDTS